MLDVRNAINYLIIPVALLLYPVKTKSYIDSYKVSLDLVIPTEYTYMDWRPCLRKKFGPKVVSHCFFN
ncbi:unnamed protein product [Linum trigynum]|uniref:Uncharacterized protein n=1 Tax=Linum trigynum TaxID=586398 RepID=A0AAV2D2G3_9ROSI